MTHQVQAHRIVGHPGHQTVGQAVPTAEDSAVVGQLVIGNTNATLLSGSIHNKNISKRGEIMYILTTYTIGDGLAVQRIEDKDVAITDIWSKIQQYSDGAITHKPKLYSWLLGTKERIDKMGFCDNSTNTLDNRSLTHKEYIDIEAHTDNHSRLALCVQFTSGPIGSVPDIIYRARLEDVHFAGSMLHT